MRMMMRKRKRRRRQGQIHMKKQVKEEECEEGEMTNRRTIKEFDSRPDRTLS
jgi:hypothetical protein